MKGENGEHGGETNTHLAVLWSAKLTCSHWSPAIPATWAAMNDAAPQLVGL